MAPSSFRDLLGMPASTASTSDSALVIIDAQNEYASGALTVTNAESSGKVIASLLEKYRSAKGKVVHVMHKTPEGAPIFTPGTDLAEEFKALKAKVWFRTSLLRDFHRLTKPPGWRDYDLEAVPWLFRANTTPRDLGVLGRQESSPCWLHGARVRLHDRSRGFPEGL